MTDVTLKFVDHSNMFVSTDMSILRELRNELSFEVPGAQFQPRVKDGFWDGIIRMIDAKGYTGIGLASYIIEWCKTMGYSIEVDSLIGDKNPIDRAEFDEWLSKLNITAKGSSITPYWYQADSVYHAMVNRKAMLNLPTSAGKSLIASLSLRFFFDFVAQESEVAVMIVPSIDLVTQMMNDMIDYGLFKREDILCIGGSYTTKVAKDVATSYVIEFDDGKKVKAKPTTVLEIDGKKTEARSIERRKKVNSINGRSVKSIRILTTNPKIIISTWQSAVKLKSNIMTKVGMLINDEAHLADGKSITSIITSAIACEYKIGLSGSLKDSLANKFQYEALFGPTYKPVTTKELMDDGQVSKLNVHCIFLKYPQEICKKASKISLKYPDEISYITKHKKRNEIVSKLAAGLGKKNQNTFVMFRHLEHGKMLYDLISSFYDKEKVFYIAGDVTPDERERIKQFTELNSGVIVVASYGVFSTGVSIRNLHNVVFAHPVKSKITVLQSIGRSLRLHDSKDSATVWDIIDDMGVIPSRTLKSKKKYSWENFGIKHGIERIERYISEEFGYKISNVNIK